MRVISTNVAARQPDPAGKHDFSGIDKLPEPFIDLAVPGPNYGDGSGVVGDAIGDEKFHGGAHKAVYAYAREELDHWEAQLGRSLRNGTFGENLTTEGIAWAEVLINQRLRLGEAVLEVSVPRTPCATFAAWMDVPRWLKIFTQRGDCGSYLRIITPGRITSGDQIEFLPAPEHDITMGMAFRAKMGDRELARRVVEAAVLPAIHHDQLAAKLS